MKIKISDDFTKTPGFRHKTDGPYSGEEFRDKILEPKYRSLTENEKLIIDLDGVEGYATSFLEEAFGGLARKCGIEQVITKVVFISTEEPLLLEEIENYIRKCNDEKK